MSYIPPEIVDLFGSRLNFVKQYLQFTEVLPRYGKFIYEIQNQSLNQIIIKSVFSEIRLENREFTLPFVESVVGLRGLLRNNRGFES